MCGLHVRRAEGMSAVRRRAVLPVASERRGRCGPLGLDEVGSPAASGAAQELNAATLHRRTAATGWNGRLDRQLPRPARPRRGASSPTPTSTSCSRRWPGSRPHRRRCARRDDRESRLAAAQEPRRLPEHPFGRAASSRATATSSGATSCTATATSSRPRWPGCARRGEDLLDGGRPAGRRPRLRRVRPDGTTGVCGHPEIEMALVELYRVTGERALPRAGADSSSTGAATARWPTSSSAAPTTRTTCRSGAPRRSPATRSARSTSPAARSTSRWRPATRELLAAIDAAVGAHGGRRTYLTGGMGSRHAGESFGEDFELPPDRAYSETCAGDRLGHAGWRLLLATGEARFADLVERTLFNVVADLAGRGRPRLLLHQPAAPARAGRAARPDADEPARRVVPAGALVRGVLLPDQHRPHAGQPRRATSPPPTPTASRCTSTRRPRSERRRRVRVRVNTGYPWGGRGRVRPRRPLVPAASQAPRPVVGPRGRPRRPWPPPPGRPGMPWWTDLEARRRVPARAPDAPPRYSPGSAGRRRAGLRRRGARPDRVLPRIDRPGRRRIVVRGVRRSVERPRRLWRRRRPSAASRWWGASRPGSLDGDPTDLTFIPYHTWGNRGLSTMRVWVPES